MDTLKDNEHIQDIELGQNTKVGGQLKSKMKKELDKNKQINGVLKSNAIVNSADKGNHTIDLRGKQYKDISFLSKLMSGEDFSQIQVINMSGNNLDDSGAKQIAELLSEKKTIKKLDISNNKLTQVGLQIICSELATPYSAVRYLDISEN